MMFFYQTCGGVAVGAGLPHFQSAAKAPQAFGANVIHGRREGEIHVEEEREEVIVTVSLGHTGDVVSGKMSKEHNIDDEE